MVFGFATRESPDFEEKREDEEEEEKEQAYNDWPNTAGFDGFHEETAPVELVVKGNIPEYALGVLYRTGPGGYDVPTSKGTTFSISHWFDGFGQTHRFQLLSSTRVLYNSRHSTDSLVAHVRRTGNIPSSFTFAQRRDPCQSLWRLFLTTFQPAMSELEGKADGLNIAVTVSRDVPGLPATAKDGKRSLYTATDASVLQGLDPDTLEPVGIARQTDLHPELKGQVSSAHAHVDPETGDLFNYNLDIGRTVTYRVFKTCKATGETEVLGTITDAPPAYIHSFFMTENFVVLCVYSAHFGMGGIKILYNKNMLDALDDVSADRRASWYVVDRRHGRGVVRKYTSDAFFAFHSVNAWEEDGGIVAEVPAYENIDIIKKFYLHNMKGETDEARKWIAEGRSRFSRFWLPGLDDVEAGEGKAQLVWAREADMSMELPSINPQFSTKPTRYTYGLTNRLKSTLMDGIMKHDSATGGHLLWEEHAHTPGEAIFVPDPAGTDEDDGVLMSVVLNGRTGLSYLLVLDAKTLKEVARAEMRCAVLVGFHGSFVGA